MKAANLVILASHGMRVPRSYVVPWSVQALYEAGSAEVDSALRQALAKIAAPGRRYAVRSSAALEDGIARSYAGQFASVLDVEGLEALLQATRAVWASARSAKVRAYGVADADSRTAELQPIRMSVIVQDMVTPVVSGVVFSRNPVTGMRETVIETVEGPGTLLLQDGATPTRWVYRNGSFVTEPARPMLSLDVVTQIVRQTRKLATAMKADLDLEFAWDGSQLHWLQMRRITALPRAQIYSSRISREMLAGLIKPLVWSINIPLINGVWIGLLTEAIGPNKLRPEDLARQFHCRAYFNMGLLGEAFEEIGLPAESLEAMWGFTPSGGRRRTMRMGRATMRLLPRLVRFIVSKWRTGARLDKELPLLEVAVRSIEPEKFSALTERELLAEYTKLRVLLEQAAYLNVIAQLASLIYNHLLRLELARARVDSSQLALGRDRPEVARLMPRDALLELKHQCETVLPDLTACGYETLLSLVRDQQKPASLRDALQRVLSDFGHMSENGNDFSTTQWRENPEAVVRLALTQSDQTNRHGDLMSLDQVDLRGARPWLVRLLYRRAVTFNLHREHVSYVYTMGYSLLRPIFRAMGDHFVRRGLLPCSDDIFFLTLTEVQQVILEDPDHAGLRGSVQRRRAELEAAREVVLPDVIYGEEPPPSPVQSSRRLTGIATSRGYCQGPACVVTGLQDFGKMQDGDVLVMPYSDVSWTPLFGRASGVVAESGGILSHSSIVAREYGIPAVVSVAGAMQLKDRAVIRVDGHMGEVLVLSAPDGPTAEGDRHGCNTHGE